MRMHASDMQINEDSGLLLSICVPTFNRAKLLKVMLESVLPQVKQHSTLVELCISDNASPDDTPEVVEQSRVLGPLNYSRNENNLGFAGNIIRLTTEMAKGKYIWLIGDDDLVLPDAIHGILEVLKKHSNIRAFHLNYQVCRDGESFPRNSFLEFNGHFDELYREETNSLLLGQWQELIEEKTGLCTAMFSQISMRACWVNHFQKMPIKPSASKLTLSHIFPHVVLLGYEVMHLPSYYYGKPVLVTFSGTQCYLDRADKIWVLIYPKLLRFFELRGMNKVQHQKCVREVYEKLGNYLYSVWTCDKYSRFYLARKYLSHAWPYRIGWSKLITVIVVSRKPLYLSWLLRKAAQVRSFFRRPVTS
jgi:glycosyltransferase involved in cell wall biosynthesis